jgi:hypothetical protein
MEPEASLQCSKEPSTASYSKQINPVHATPSHLPKKKINLIEPVAVFQKFCVTSLTWNANEKTTIVP